MDYKITLTIKLYVQQHENISSRLTYEKIQEVYKNSDAFEDVPFIL